MEEENNKELLNQKLQNSNSVKSSKKFILIIIIIMLIVISVGFYFIAIRVSLNSNSSRGNNGSSLEEKIIFQNKYGINDQIKVNNRFIYFRYPGGSNLKPPEYLIQLVVSDASGQNLVVLNDIIQVIDSLDEPRSELMFPSPKGSYYISLFQDGRVGTVFDINGKEIFKIPKMIEYADVLKWSHDERYLARVDGDLITVYDVLRGMKIFEKELNVKEELNAVTHDLDMTRPKVVWAENDDILYSFDESGIKIISNFDATPALKNIVTPYPCYGLAPRENEFFCANKMGNVWSGSKKTPYSGSVTKYTLLGDQLSEPQSVTVVPLGGEYDADLYFLDDKYLLFTPSLGLNTVIDVDSGKIAELSDFGVRTSIDHSKELELFNERGDYPIIYKGDK